MRQGLYAGLGVLFGIVLCLAALWFFGIFSAKNGTSSTRLSPSFSTAVSPQVIGRWRTTWKDQLGNQYEQFFEFTNDGVVIFQSSQIGAPANSTIGKYWILADQRLGLDFDPFYSSSPSENDDSVYNYSLEHDKFRLWNKNINVVFERM